LIQADIKQIAHPDATGRGGGTGVTPWHAGKRRLDSSGRQFSGIPSYFVAGERVLAKSS